VRSPVLTDEVRQAVKNAGFSIRRINGQRFRIYRGGRGKHYHLWLQQRYPRSMSRFTEGGRDYEALREWLFKRKEPVILVRLNRGTKEIDSTWVDITNVNSAYRRHFNTGEDALLRNIVYGPPSHQQGSLL
jgi:hypothetical protein